MCYNKSYQLSRLRAKIYFGIQAMCANSLISHCIRRRKTVEKNERPIENGRHVLLLSFLNRLFPRVKPLNCCQICRFFSSCELVPVLFAATVVNHYVDPVSYKRRGVNLEDVIRVKGKMDPSVNHTTIILQFGMTVATKF